MVENDGKNQVDFRALPAEQSSIRWSSWFSDVVAREPERVGHTLGRRGTLRTRRGRASRPPSLSQGLRVQLRAVQAPGW